MTAVTVPGRARRSLIGMCVSAVAARRSRITRRPSKAAQVAAVARQHVVTVAALASVDVGAFHAGPVAGWIVTGVSLFLLDFAVTG